MAHFMMREREFMKMLNCMAEKTEYTITDHDGNYNK